MRSLLFPVDLCKWKCHMVRVARNCTISLATLTINAAQPLEGKTHFGFSRFIFTNPSSCQVIFLRNSSSWLSLRASLLVTTLFTWMQDFVCWRGDKKKVPSMRGYLSIKHNIINLKIIKLKNSNIVHSFGITINQF